MCYGSWPSSLWSNADKDQYDALVILFEVLEQRTGNQGWFMVSNDARDSRGLSLKGYVALHCGNSRARSLCSEISDTPDFKAVWYAESLIDEPKLDNCRVFDDRDQRAITALYWLRSAERYESWTRDIDGSFWHTKAEYVRKKANKALNGTTEVTCDCGHVHNHPGDNVPLPTSEDVRKMIEKIVDANLVPFLEKDREKF